MGWGGQCVHLEHKEVGAGEKVGRPSCTDIFVKPTSVCEFVFNSSEQSVEWIFSGHTYQHFSLWSQ